MTKNEAVTRAEKVWPGKVESVEPDPAHSDKWSIRANGRYHILDANGHAVCHQPCVNVESALDC